MKGNKMKKSIQLNVQKVWESVFEREGIGIDDDFFEIGGDSIKAMKIYSELSGLYGKIEIDDFFQCTSIRSLSEKLSGMNDKDSYPSKYE